MFTMALLQQADISSDDLAAKAKHKAQQLQEQQQAENDKNFIEERFTHVGIHCPQCNEKSLIERTLGPQLQQLTPNSVSGAENDDENTVGSDEHKSLCDNCDENEASCYCKQCASKLCEQCFSVTHKHKIFATHEKLPQGDENAVTSAKKHYCVNHPTSEIEFYCKQCNVLTCAKCGMVDVHKNHEHVTIADYLTQIAILRIQHLQQDKLPQVKQQLEHTRDQINDTLTQVVQQNTSISKTMKKRFEELNNKISKHRLIITSEIISQGSVCEFELAAKLTEIKQLLNSVQVLEHVNVAQSSSAVQVYKIVDKMSTVESSIVSSYSKINNSILQAQKYADLVYKNQCNAVQQIEMIEQYKYQNLEQELCKCKQTVQDTEIELAKLKQDQHALQDKSNEQQQLLVKYQSIFLTNAGFVNGIKSYINAQKIESLTIPCHGIYHFKVCGAQGDEHYKGGSGAIIECDIKLKLGDMLEILCGSYRSGGYGGGGSFISVNGRKNPLVVAGGGGCDQGGKDQYDEEGGNFADCKGGTKGGKGPNKQHTSGYQGAGYYEDAPNAKSFVNGGLEGGSYVAGGGYSGGAYTCKYLVFVHCTLLA